MNVLSLCDGMSCGYMALEKANINIDKYYASEIKSEAIACSEHNFPDIVHIGNVKAVSYSDGILHTECGDFKEDFDIVMFGSPCFTGDTLVYTKDGYKEIRNININDYVLSHDNKFHKVVDSMMTGVKQIYSIKCLGSDLIKTTSNHKFYVRKGINDTPKWVELKDLIGEKYYVGHPINEELDLNAHNFSFDSIVVEQATEAYLEQQYFETKYHKACFVNLVLTSNGKYYIVEFENDDTTDTFYKDNCIWYPIEEIIETEYFDEVYDITVEDTHSFTANNIIVHNCQSFSRAMKTDMRIGLEDDMRSGIFLECYRVLQEVKPKYFLMENVIMKPSDEKIITTMLGVEPIRINSSLVSAQERDRLYWTNIPNVTVPKDKRIFLKDILKDGYTEKQKARCLMQCDSHGYYNGCNWNAPARYHREHYKSFTTMIYPSEEAYNLCVDTGREILKGRNSEAELFNDYKGHEFDCMRYLWKEERARLQTVPEKYVECLNERDAADLLGDGWTVDVIAHIFKGLNKNRKPTSLWGC